MKNINIFLIRKFKDLTSNSVVRDMSFTALLQVMNLIIPLLITPFLISKLGLEKYGWIAICQAFANYLLIVTDYGFNLTGVRDVAKYKDDKAILSKQLTSITLLKVIALLIIILVLLSLKYILPHNVILFDLLILNSVTILGQLLFPLWLFQGLGNVILGTALLLSNRLLYSIGVILFIHNNDSLYHLFYVQGICSCISLIVLYLYVCRVYKLFFTLATIEEFLFLLKTGWHIFLSNVFINIYTGSSVLILGMLHGTKTSAIFAIADQVLSLLRQPIALFIRVIYPKLCSIAKDSHVKVILLFKQTIPVLALLYLVMSTVTFVFAEKISLFFSSTNSLEVAHCLRIICVVPIFVLLLNIPPYLTMLTYRLDKLTSRIIMYGAVFGFISNIVLSYFFSYVGSCLSVLITEILVGVSLSLMFKKRYPQYKIY